MKICIYAAASDKIEGKYIQSVELLGEKLAKEGHSLIYGAGGTGLMGAAARGFRKGNGEVIGVAPKFMHEIEPLFKDCTQFIETEDMADRKEIMENGCDAFVIVPGGIGTFDEFFQTLTLKELGQHNKPIVVFNFDNYYTKLLSYMDDCIVKGFIKPRVRALFAVAASHNDVLKALK